MPHKSPDEARAWRRSWYAALPRERKQKMLASDRDRATKVRRHVDAIKIERGCIDCGYAGHPAALDFDHVEGEKDLLVSFAKSIAQADREIVKCEVRCARCHRIRTWERKTGQIAPSRAFYPCKPDIFEATYEPV